MAFTQSERQRGNIRPIHSRVDMQPEGRRFQKLADKMRAARDIFPSHANPIFPVVDHDGRGLKQTPAVDYLLDHGANPEELEELFGERGEWNFDAFPYDPYTTNPDILDRTLKEHLMQLNRLIGRSLDGTSTMGFNKHGDGHSSRVTKDAQVIAKAASYMRDENDRLQQNQATVTGRLHDVGNLFSRSLHNVVSDRMAPLIVPNLVKDPDRRDLYHQIRAAIIFHPSDKLRVLTTEIWPRMNPEDRWARMVEMFGIGGLAMIAADKIDISRHRISDQADSNTIFEDPHAEVNYWGQSNGWYIEGNELNWVLQYTPQINESDIKRFPHFAAELRRKQRERDKSYVPRYFEEWRDLVNELYGNRIVTFADCMLALFPKIKRVDVVFAQEQGAGGHFLRFERETFDKDSRIFLEKHKSLWSE